jgi:hypothetical protein
MKTHTISFIYGLISYGLIAIGFAVGEEQRITKYIDDEPYEFMIPSDYATLKAQYLELIDIYIACENDLTTLEKATDMSIAKAKQIITQYAELSLAVTNLTSAITKERQDFMKGFLHVGAMAGYSQTLRGNSTIMAAPYVLFVKQAVSLMVSVPIAVPIADVHDIAFGSMIGVSIPLRFRK